ncbi:hypothetical protein B0A49_02349 [Cryomyces minteri]|uniref:SSD domain-containing protein n=1 Tax=Cryomyces minteri TaxID=331657 RepID=A0A4U0XMD0_9PEZI|nr:hypothetical protein B0A49_02349 [Cryomyces minteri]
MIWYLLYPFRGTTEPPSLSSNHPIRKAFYRHGAATARHWLLSMLISVAVGVVLCYPVVFLYEDPTAGYSNLPHHVSTSASLFNGRQDSNPDVEMRQLWIHGSYMKALDQRVLQQALVIQDTAFGEGIDYMSPGTAERRAPPYVQPPGSTSPQIEGFKWGYHSPLMHWNCFASAIDADDDILNTINEQAYRRSYFNFTLRPTSVFAGKSFARSKLLAADALVITLFNRFSVRSSLAWEERFASLAEQSQDRWSTYPTDGKVRRSQLYEFRFQPMSTRDDLILAIAYSFMAFYVMIATSITASFAICGILKINLAQVPREAYPFVVLVIGLENMFRLINAVIAISPEMPIHHRMANALGDVGHLSLAASAQNLLLLWVLSRLSSPGVSAFCAFAAVALVFDFVFHLTFFVAVLSVDVRRMELRDSLDRVSSSHLRAKSIGPEQHTWMYALGQGRMPFSTRIAGSAIMVTFVMGLNWRYFDNENQAQTVLQFLRKLWRQRTLSAALMPAPMPPPMNRTRTPTAWLKMQDYDTAKEIIQFIRPQAHGLIARIYDPLIIVLHGADRSGAINSERSWLVAVRELANMHFFPFTLAVIFILAFITLLMNYLTYRNVPDDATDQNLDEPVLSVRTLKCHELDILKLAACSKGHFVSIGLDYMVSIGIFNPTKKTYAHIPLTVATMNPSIWPIIAAVIDDSGEWLALCSASGRVAVWHLPSRHYTNLQHVPLGGQLPLAFSFASMYFNGPVRLVIVTPDGWLTDLDFQSGYSNRFEICANTLLLARLLPSVKTSLEILALSRSGHVYMAKQVLGKWVTRRYDTCAPGCTTDGEPFKIRSFTTVPTLGMYITVRNDMAALIDPSSSTVVRMFQIGQLKGHSLRVLHSHPRQCSSCGAVAVHTFSLVYNERETGRCAIHTFAINDATKPPFCLRFPRESNESYTCHLLADATETLHRLDDPGTWEATSAQSIIGTRHNPAGSDAELFSSSTRATNGLLRRRKEKVKSKPVGDADGWEAYTFSSTGDFYAVPLNALSNPLDPQGMTNEQLFTTKAGPICRLGPRSVAVAFANVVKFIMLRNERFQEGADEALEPAFASVSYRRKHPVRTHSH